MSHAACVLQPVKLGRGPSAPIWPQMPQEASVVHAVCGSEAQLRSVHLHIAYLAEKEDPVYYLEDVSKLSAFLCLLGHVVCGSCQELLPMATVAFIGRRPQESSEVGCLLVAILPIWKVLDVAQLRQIRSSTIPCQAKYPVLKWLSHCRDTPWT